MEYIECDECNGKGIVPESEFPNKVCQKCFGSKKLDWVENVVGVKRFRMEFTNFPSSISDEITEHLSKEICLDVDRHIMEKIIKNGKI